MGNSEELIAGSIEATSSGSDVLIINEQGPKNSHTNKGKPEDITSLFFDEIVVKFLWFFDALAELNLDVFAFENISCSG